MSGDKTTDTNNVATINGETSNQIDVSVTQNDTGTDTKEVKSIDGLQGDIDAWSKQADCYLDLTTSGKDIGRKLAMSKDDSAWYFYCKVLEKDLANAYALNGIQVIGNYDLSIKTGDKATTVVTDGSSSTLTRLTSTVAFVEGSLMTESCQWEPKNDGTKNSSE